MQHLYKHWTTLLLFIASSGFAQHKIYFESGTVTCRILHVSGSVLSYTDASNPASKISIPLKKVEIIFNDRGDYLIPKSFEADAKQLVHQAAHFLDSSQRAVETDRIFTTNNRRLEENIIREDRRFLYLNSGPVEKRSVAVIIYKNGNHKLMVPVLKAVDILSAFTSSPVDDYISQNTIPVAMSNHVSTSDSIPQKSENNRLTSTSSAFEELAGKVSRDEFIEKSKQKTIKLNDYLKLICDRSTNYEDMTKAIDQAVNLFVSENAIVETSSLNRNDVKRHTIKNYLSHIKMVRYDKIEIEWTAVQFVSDIRKGPDGNYHGVVSFEQVFRGYRDGRLVYQDITKKHANVVLKAMEQSYQGTTTTVWDVLLSDIGVISTRSV